MRGCYISLIGSDGTGKSSIARLLKMKFEKHYGRASLLYMGSLNHALVTSRLLSRLSILNQKAQKSKHGTNKAIKKTGFGLVSLIKELTFLHYIVELFARYYFWIRPRIKKGEIVITDRYIYDFLIIERFLNNYDWFKNFIIRITPVPDLLVCLYNNPEVILERKKDNSAEETTRQNIIFLSLERQVKSFRKIKTDATIEEIADKIFMEMGEVLKSKHLDPWG